jgi:hypothetical protein
VKVEKKTLISLGVLLALARITTIETKFFDNPENAGKPNLFPIRYHPGTLTNRSAI